MSWERVAQQLRRASAQWRRSDAPVHGLSEARAGQLLERARELLAAGGAKASGRRDNALIVTKAPHTGSDMTVVAILARCLAFGLTIERVARKEPEEADSVAHALYPDVWLNFVRLPSGGPVWSKMEATFDNDDYATIFRERYRRDAVVTGHQACLDNNLTFSELMAIWQTGREPLTRAAATSTYGPRATTMLFGEDGADTHQWYRGRFPVGIHRIGPSLMAFALKHERLYDGRPVIVLNGQYTLLWERFRGVGGLGPAVIELGLGERPSIRDIRDLLVGAADNPRECRPGSIRRDAHDGFFDTDAPETPVVPWANAVHASDGYLAGAIETAAVLGGAGGSMGRRLTRLGYTAVEVGTLVMKDPIVSADGDEQRLTRRAAMMSRDECVHVIRRYFPPLGSHEAPPASEYLITALIGASVADRSTVAIDQPRSEAGSRRPARESILDCAELPESLADDGRDVIVAGGLGLLVPAAGSGGRFGGYDVAEGSSARLKPLLPVFTVNGLRVSAMDVRAGHVRALAREGAGVPMLFSCSHATEPALRDWLARNPDVEAEVARVPEMYRIRADRWEPNAGGAPEISGADAILRDTDGVPLLKPSGNLGLLIAAAHSGFLRRCLQRRVRVVVAANADDVGFRVDPRIVGLLTGRSAPDAVVLSTPVSGGAVPRGGLLRERPVADGWSAYVEEHAAADPTAGGEQFSTNQIYFRLDSVLRLFSDLCGDGMDGIRRRLPLYFEIKYVRVGDERVGALHAYQAYADVLRLLPSVVALSMAREPRPGQARGYAPLKSPSDIEPAQAIVDAIAAMEDRLSFG